MKARVLNTKTAKTGIYVGRPTKWGNPFVLGRDGDRATVVRRYEEWIKTQPHLLADLPSLRGHDLRCWCAPEACHADVLLRLANEEVEPCHKIFSPNSTSNRPKKTESHKP